MTAGSLAVIEPDTEAARLVEGSLACTRNVPKNMFCAVNVPLTAVPLTGGAAPKTLKPSTVTCAPLTRFPAPSLTVTVTLPLPRKATGTDRSWPLVAISAAACPRFPFVSLTAMVYLPTATSGNS